MPGKLAQDAPRLPPCVRAQKRIFAAVPADAKLGQAEDLHLVGAGLRDGVADARGIAIPIQRDLIQDSGTNGEQLHAGCELGVVGSGQIYCNPN